MSIQARRHGRGARLRRMFLLGLLLGIPACGIDQYLDDLISDGLAGLDRFGTDPGPPVYTAKSFVNWETPHVSPLALAPDASRLFAVNTPAARLEVFDVTDGGLVHLRAIPVGLDPVTVRPRSANEVWVVNYISDSISVVDVDLGIVTRTIQTDDEPTDVVFSGGRAFVVCRQRNHVEVFDLNNLAAPPQTLTIAGEHPRAAALSPDGRYVYVAIFESGNGTTIIPHQAVSDPSGPYGGQNPPPNTPNGFSPPIPEGTPPAPPAGLIVQRDPATGRWLDEQGADWSAFVTWGLHGHDVAVIDTQTLDISYIRDLMNLNMDLSVRPDGALTVVGTEAFNLTRFEPNVTGRFVRSRLAIVPPGGAESPQILELNPHLLDEYEAGISTIPIEERALSIADPRAILWSADGSRGFVAGLGSNNVAVIGPDGARLATFDVGQGPTGLALDDAAGRLYVLNRFDASISVVDTNTLAVGQLVAFYDPTPEAIRRGRPFLYDARRTSGLGVTACGACHVDGRIDQLAWDLSVPGDPVAPFSQVCDDLGGSQFLNNPVCEDPHPVKGPMMTQTLQGVIGTEPFHWRGDRTGLEGFNHAFISLNGNHAELTAEEMAAFKEFLATITYPPNPNRNRDNSLKTELDGGNPQHGMEIFLNEPIDLAVARLRGLPPFIRQRLEEVGPILSCNRCHQLPAGTNRRITTSEDLHVPQSMKVPQLRNVYEKAPFDRHSQENSRGFGFTHDGAVATLEEFFSLVVFEFGEGAEGAQRMQDVIAFVKSMGVDTHAGVGTQITLDASNAAGADALALTALMLEMADRGEIGVVVYGLLNGQVRALSYRGSGQFEADGDAQMWSADALRAASAAGEPLTWTVVPLGSEDRLR